MKSMQNQDQNWTGKKQKLEPSQIRFYFFQ